jgi:Abortive infection C-terminus
MDDGHFKILRSEFMADPTTDGLLPEFVRTCADTGDFWQFIKHEFSTYAERREFLRKQFSPLFEYAEKAHQPSVSIITDTLDNFDAENVGTVWGKALKRTVDDPEGAITTARTLLETVCKHILDDGVAVGSKYGAAEDLPKLYGLVAKELNLAPSQHTETIFKQILGGCSGVVEGLGALRNRVGDAHGQGRRPVKVLSRHATLAVNLAGAVSTFLVETAAAKRTN